jgi:hypothetical protein
LLAVTERGSDSSAAAAEQDSRMAAQALRDSGDIQYIKAVNGLKVGESLKSVSLEPAEELKKYPEIYRDRYGYREGLVYIHWAHKVDEETVVMGSFSVDGSDPEVWRELFAEQDVDVPEGESPNTWNQHHIKQTDTSLEETIESVRQLRDGYYKQVGKTEQRFVMNDYVDQENEAIDERFRVYYRALSEALDTRRNNEVLQDFANILLQDQIDNLNPDLRGQLIRIANQQSFDDDAARDMDSILRYAATEQLRTGLESFMNSSDETKVTPVAATERPSYRFVAFTGMSPAAVQALHYQTASNVSAGVQARRSYGGCPGQIRFHMTKDLSESDMFDIGLQQDQNKDSAEQSNSDRIGATITCIKCRQPVKKKAVEQHDKETGEVKSWRCPSCKYEVDVCTGEEMNPSRSLDKPEEKPQPVTILETFRQEKLASEREVAKLALAAA